MLFIIQLNDNGGVAPLFAISCSHRIATSIIMDSKRYRWLKDFSGTLDAFYKTFEFLNRMDLAIVIVVVASLSSSLKSSLLIRTLYNFLKELY